MQPLVGKVLVFTGTLEVKRAEATQMATAAGATVAGTVSGKTDILVVGRDAGSKVAAAEKKGVVIWTEAQFVAACGGGNATAPKASPGHSKKSAPADEPPAKKAANAKKVRKGKEAAVAAPPSRAQGKARARAQANVASVEAAEVLARNLNARDLVVAVLGDAALVDYIFCRGGVPTACAAAPACKEWSVLAKAAIARWQRVCSSAWSRAGIRDEREWVGSYTDDGDAGDFDGPFWLGPTANGGFVVAEDDQNDMRTQFFDVVGSRDSGREGHRDRLAGPTIRMTIDLAPMASSLGVDRLRCMRQAIPALCEHEDALYVALTLEMVPYFTPYAECMAARQAAYAARPCTRRVVICRHDLASGTTHPPAGSLCELEMTYVGPPLPESPDDENHPSIAVHAGTVYVHVGDRIAMLDAQTLAPCGSLGAAELTSAATDASRWLPSYKGGGSRPSPQDDHRFSMRPEASHVSAIAVYTPASELYFAVPRTADILVFAIGDHAHSGRCVRRLEGCREARERPVHLAVGGHAGWLFVAAAQSDRVLRLSRDGFVLQAVALFECTVSAGLAVGSGAVGSSEVYVLCNAPGEWNVYGEGDSTVHVLQIRSGDGEEGGDGGGSSDEPAGSSTIAPTAPTGSWQVKGGFGYGSEDEWAVVPPYLARILEAAHRRGDAHLTSMHRGHPLEIVLQPEPPHAEMYCSPPSFGGSEERYALRRE